LKIVQRGQKLWQFAAIEADIDELRR